MAITTHPQTNALHDEASPDPSRPSPTSRWRARLRTFGAALTLSAAMAAGGYVAGRVHAFTAARETQAQLQVAVDEHQRAFAKAESQHQSEVQRMQAELARSAQAQAHLARTASLLVGLRHTSAALRALDERNFGVADDARRSARDVLAPLAGSLPELAPVVTKLDALALVVTTNSGAQREALLSIASSLEPIIDREHAASTQEP